MLGRIIRSAVVLLGVCAPVLAADLPGVWLDVPFVKQEKDGCGAASIAMVMQYWQRQQGQGASADSDAAQIQHALYSAGLTASMLPTWSGTSRRMDSARLQFAESGKISNNIWTRDVP